MIGKILNIGDEVIINIPDENWEWGYHPVPEQKGTRAKVTGFSEIEYTRVQNYGMEPGIYVNHSWVYLEGIKDAISACFLEFPDEEGYQRRMEHWRANQDQYVRLRDLPETELWEQDIVEPISSRMPWEGVTRLRVTSINYNYIGKFCNDSVTPMPIYNVEPVGGGAGYIAVRGSELKLVERGNIWKHYNGEKPVFKDLKEEMAFAKLLGQTDEVPNEATGKYSWTMAELIPAVKAGKVDVLKMSDGFFGGKPMRRAIRFRDRDLGERVRAEFLKEFGDADVEELDRMAAET